MDKTKHIQMLIGKMQVLKFHSPVAENIKFLISDFELDVISVSKSGMLCEFEVKISRGDFKADAKKRKHLFYSQKPELAPNYFSYACPKDLIKLSEIGTGVGLYYIDNGEVIEVQAPKRLHAKIHDRIKILEKICRVNSERQFLGACRLTYENKELIKRTAKYFNKPVSVMPDLIPHNNINTMEELKKRIEAAYLEQNKSAITVLEITGKTRGTNDVNQEFTFSHPNVPLLKSRSWYMEAEGKIHLAYQTEPVWDDLAPVYPSDEKTISVRSCPEYGGAHAYMIRNCLGFNDGKTQYDKSYHMLQFVHKADDGTIVPGLQSEQLVLALIDRHEKLNARFPSPQNEKMLQGLKMFVEACEERVKERIERGVMGNLQK